MKKRYDRPALINPYDAPGQRRTGASAPATSHRRNVDAASDEVLDLPAGAIAALRKSGGIAFRTREVVVYGDGRVVRRGVGGGRGPREDAAQRLSEAQVAELSRLAQKTSFPKRAFAAPAGGDRPTYELAARAGGAVKTAEAAQGRVPAGLAPLVGWLERLLSEDEG